MNPLDQLADISTPQTVSVWPLAWGYWVLFALIFLIIFVAIYKITQYRKHTLVKRHSLVALTDIDLNDPDFYYRVQVINKQFFAHYFPHQYAKASGGRAFIEQALVEYNQNARKNKQSQQVESALSYLFSSLYEPTAVDSPPEINKQEEVLNNVKHFIVATTPAFGMFGTSSASSIPRQQYKTSHEASHV